MSNQTSKMVTRYSNWCAVTHGHEMMAKPDGSWVLFADYQIAIAELLTARLEIERLRAALEQKADVAAATAHRACCGTEHDAANGKLHGYCVVCGVPWPCDTASYFLRGAPETFLNDAPTVRPAVAQVTTAVTAAVNEGAIPSGAAKLEPFCPHCENGVPVAQVGNVVFHLSDKHGSIRCRRAHNQSGNSDAT